MLRKIPNILKTLLVVILLASGCKQLITPATVTTEPVTNITATSVVCGGNITSNGNGTVSSFGVCYSTGNRHPSITDNITTNGSGVKNYTTTLTGLTESTTYYLRAYVTNEEGTSYGSTATFKTTGFCVPIISGLTNNLFDVCFADANNGWTVGNGNILYTNNGGTNWATQTNPTNYQLNAVCFANSSTGCAVGYNGTVLTTTNGGNLWTAQTRGLPNTILFDVCFTNTTKGYLVGEGGAILTTSNGGANWTAQASSTNNRLYSVCFPNANTGYAVGINGTILTTTNGGANWTAQNSGTTNDLFNIYFVNSTTGWIVGNNGTILYTTNGGANWAAQTSNTTNFLRAVYFTDTNNGYAVGNAGTVLTTNNGGTTWVVQISGTGYALNSVYTTGQHNYAVGNAGTILQF